MERRDAKWEFIRSGAWLGLGTWPLQPGQSTPVGYRRGIVQDEQSPLPSNHDYDHFGVSTGDIPRSTVLSFHCWNGMDWGGQVRGCRYLHSPPILRFSKAEFNQSRSRRSAEDEQRCVLGNLYTVCSR